MTIGDIDPAALWLAGGLALGIAELFVPGVFLIFLAIAAGVTALTVWAIPELPAVLQLVEFAVWSVVCVVIGRCWYRDFPVDSDAPVLNEPARRLRGQVVTVTTPIISGEGRARLGDGEWPVRGPDAGAGTRLRVAHVENGVLLVEPLSD
ncbi:nfeD-like family protein [Sphingomonas sp. S17]|uniref:NfeD family protein n=2 Tax=Sphingomonas paucimobilis TaxID=13689 RepID=A0A411LFV0_SPHPI|nr:MULTISPECIES: NfeD family protein [Sphingomonas]EGI57051.1 nfeD-like family protein [Sphingomonas sp. S17]MCM3679062.1 NfeD family protein [Sphingomonas paucimobilis]MDG5971816.1 NfeD family protein [Sphingomonas paucimobilis]NNG58174.1 NfeD family protein [Sphingomonas paucimobilis]QBE91213.1 NfeD family protein [Sphingomonas paucimobilis]